MTRAGPGARAWFALRRGFDAVRSSPTRQWLLQVLAALVGLAAVTVHWSGLLVGGALVGVLSRSLRRALFAGLAFGAFAWTTFAIRLAVGGALEFYLASGELALVGLVASLGLGTLGGLARALVP